jgi:hypothetical protein
VTSRTHHTSGPVAVSHDARRPIAGPETPDAVVHGCGNTADVDGFVPVENGRLVEPTAEAWPSGELACQRCGGVLDETGQDTGRTVDLTADDTSY